MAAQEHDPAWFAVGIAAALYRLMNETDARQDAGTGREKLCAVTGLAPDERLTQDVMALYARLLEGASIADLRRAAQDLAAAGLGDIL